MFNQTDFFEQTEQTGPGQAGNVMGQIGTYGLHVAKIAFLIYSGYHGISASINYAGSSEIAKLAQIIGIIVTEITLLSIYLAWHNQYITGITQMIAAGCTYASGFILACLGIIADSQLHSGANISGWLVSYLLWGLPIAPAIMALGALFTHELAPNQLRSRKQTAARQAHDDLRFAAFIASQRAELEANKSIANANLNARMSAARQIAAHYNSDEIQTAIRTTALDNVPALLRAAGIDPETVHQNQNGLDEGEIAAYLDNNPESARRIFTFIARNQGEDTPFYANGGQ